MAGAAQGVLERLEPARAQVARLVRARFTVPVAVVVSFLLRLPGLGRPLRADEAGFLLVGRAWDPAPESVYGPFFVDRPPTLIGLVRLADELGGATALRLLGAACVAALVLLAAATARLVAGDLTARWTALAAAALCGSPLIDVVAAKGELLALPFLMGSVLAALVAVRRRRPALAVAAGFAGILAMGMKQNLWGGLVFAVTLVVATGIAERGPGALRRTATLLTGVLAGALVPVVATLEWALANRVELDTLWYTVVGFRADATAVLAEASAEDSAERAGLLVLCALGAGLLPVIGGFLVHARSEWREDAPLTAAVLAMLAMDLVGLAAGGSYWRDYLFPLVVPAVLCAATLARRPSARGRAMRAVVAGLVASSLVSLGAWVAINAVGAQEYDEAGTGAAVGAAAEDGDDLLVYGGRPDLLWASGLEPAAYPHLWSLPMRVLDPELLGMESLVRSDDAPAWLVEWVPFETWDDEVGSRLRYAVEARYVLHGRGCRGRPVWLRADLERPALDPACS